MLHEPSTMFRIVLIAAESASGLPQVFEGKRALTLYSV